MLIARSQINDGHCPFEHSLVDNTSIHGSWPVTHFPLHAESLGPNESAGIGKNQAMISQQAKVNDQKVIKINDSAEKKMTDNADRLNSQLTNRDAKSNRSIFWNFVSLSAGGFS